MSRRAQSLAEIGVLSTTGLYEGASKSFSNHGNLLVVNVTIEKHVACGLIDSGATHTVILVANAHPPCAVESRHVVQIVMCTVAQRTFDNATSDA